MGSIIAAIVQGAVSALLAPFKQWWKDRQLVSQGRAEQKASDDAAAVKEAVSAQQIDESVDRLSDADLDQRLRRRAGPSA